MKVLVTGAGALLGQGIIRSLRNSSLEAKIVAVDPSPLSAGLYWADERHAVPMARDPGYLDRIRAILDSERPDAVLIGTDVELDIFARNREQLEREFDTRVIVSRPEVIAIADDKYLTYQFMRENGFDFPASALPGDGDQLDQLIASVGFPLIVKPRVGARSVGVSTVHDREQLAAALAAARSEPVVQECVATDDEEYTAGVLGFDGSCQASIVMRRDLRDGNTYRAYVQDYPHLNAQLRRIGEKLDIYGPANFQFRLDGARIKIFEINARFSGTTPLRAHAGFNEVEMVLRHVLSGDPIVQPKVKPMTILRHWSETIVPAGQLFDPGRESR